MTHMIRCFWGSIALVIKILLIQSLQFRNYLFRNLFHYSFYIEKMHFFIKILSIFLLFLLLQYSKANLCNCDLTIQDMVCGSNSITYRNRCEFECTQREYMKLGRILKLQKNGHC